MHAYERHILHRLALHQNRRFSELKPKGAESNLFIYHLKNLITLGLIKKIEHGYTLTGAGNRYVDKLSLTNLETRFQPKIVTVIICKNKEGKYLLMTRKRQPFYGLIGFPYGKIHFGEKIEEAAQRELREKTGLCGKLIRRGEAYLTISTNGELMTHMLCHVFFAKQPIGELMTKTESGDCEWKNIKDVDQKRFIPGFLEIFRLTTSTSKIPFFKELVFI